MGNNYNIDSFQFSPDGGETATGIATITTEYVGCDGSKAGKVLDIYLTNTGCGYTVPPKITFETPKGYTGSGLPQQVSVQLVLSNLSLSQMVEVVILVQLHLLVSLHLNMLGLQGCS